MAVVANSGDNTLSILSISRQHVVSQLGLVRGVPSPYAVVQCFEDVLVTSPSDNSIRLVRAPQGEITKTIRVGLQPKAAACYLDQTIDKRRALVSNYGDNTISVVDTDSGSTVATITGVPGARGLRGVVIYQDNRRNLFAWVGGTDANAVTIVDLTTYRVLTQLPVRAPTAVYQYARDIIMVASETDGTITVFDPDLPGPGFVRYSSLVKPQDLLYSNDLGMFVTQGGASTVARIKTDQVTTITGIPGAAALALYGFDSVSGIMVTGTDSNSVYVLRQSLPLPSQFDLSNGASFTPSPVAPGSLSSAFALTGLSQPFFATALPLPTTLGGVSLSIGGTLQPNSSGGFTYSTAGASLAPLLFVGPTQVNFQLPLGTSPGDSVAAQLTKADGSTLLTTVRVTATALGIFTLLQNGQGQAAALNQDNTRNGDPAASVGAKFAARGTVIQIFATGAGATNPPVTAGVAAPSNPLALAVVQPAVTIGGKAAQVQFSGLAPGFVGLWQINAVIPADVTPGNAIPLTISAGGQTSNTVTIAVQ